MELNRGNIKKILLMVFAAILFFYAINNFGIVLEVTGGAIGLCFPFILGCAIAFIINVPMSRIERALFKRSKSGRVIKAGRPISLALTIVIAASVLTGAVLIIAPEIGATVKSLIEQIPEAWTRFMGWLETTPLNGELIEKYESEIEEIWNNMSDSVISALKTGAIGALNTGIGVVGGVVSGVTNFVIAFIFSMYVLLQKEKLGTQITRILRAVLPKRADAILRIASVTNSTFAGFITGQCLEACILGTMFVITMTILGIPYAVLIGILIAFTALIPIVGAFIGCIVGAVLIVIVSPVKALIFIILFLVLQQIEGNLIYPHVVGNSVGLPSIWVLVAVTVGSKLMGIVGMIIFIPIFSVGYAMLREFVEARELAAAEADGTNEQESGMQDADGKQTETDDEKNMSEAGSMDDSAAGDGERI